MYNVFFVCLVDGEVKVVVVGGCSFVVGIVVVINFDCVGFGIEGICLGFGVIEFGKCVLVLIV